jgi:3-phosphoshikimate 1-carboxyvinyltransferase
VRASGTTARFLTAVAALTAAGVEVTLDGSARMRERPIGDLVAALCALGADAQALGPRGCPPVRVRGGGLAGGRITIDARRSSQYVSGVLLAAPAAAHDVEVALVEGRLVSRPFVDLTLQVMNDFGADARWTDAGGLVVRSGRPYVGRRYAIEPDAQAAVYAFAAAAIAGGRVVVEGIPPDSRQPDLRVLDALAAMGCRVERSADTIELAVTAGTLRGVRLDGDPMPDAVLALSVVALFAEGPTEIRNVANLRIKETDRLAALESEIRRLGGRAEAGPDWIRIEPAPLHGAAIETYADHRMAMSFALAGLAVAGVAIRDPGCVAKTWPGFFAALETW